jgi:6-pyruvoyltetrahydropterin/6-carboxytetrahydropterin synthase
VDLARPTIKLRAYYDNKKEFIMTAAAGSTGAGNIAGMHTPQSDTCYTSTKFFKEIGPCAYRNWQSDSDCYLLHGYDRSFKFVFGCKNLDKQGFVVDLGGLKEIKRQLEYWFDHTVILQADDPMVGIFRKLEKLGHCALRTFPLISCEGLPEFVGEYVDHMLHEKNGGRNWVISCEVIEAEKNSSIYTPKANPDRMAFQDILDMTKQLELETTHFTLD